jgi:ubiquinone/menaquinone biosynthesis C-methylase UbiE
MMGLTQQVDQCAEAYRRERPAHWDLVARQMDSWKGWNGYYHHRLAEIYRFLIAPGQRVLELGCSQGDLLAAVKPSYGVGVDFSGEMVARSAKCHAELKFIQVDVHTCQLDKTFDVDILSDLLNDGRDVQTVFEQVRRVTTPHSRVVICSYSRLWEQARLIGTRFGKENAQ